MGLTAETVDTVSANFLALSAFSPSDEAVPFLQILQNGKLGIMSSEQRQSLTQQVAQFIARIPPEVWTKYQLARGSLSLGRFQSQRRFADVANLTGIFAPRPALRPVQRLTSDGRVAVVMETSGSAWRSIFGGSKAKKEAQRRKTEEAIQHFAAERKAEEEAKRLYFEAARPIAVFLSANFRPTFRNSRNHGEHDLYYDKVCIANKTQLSIKVTTNDLLGITGVEITERRDMDNVDFQPLERASGVPTPAVLTEVMNALQASAGTVGHKLEMAFLPSTSLEFGKLFGEDNALKATVYVGIGLYKGGTVSAIVITKSDFGMERVYLHSTNPEVQREFARHANDSAFPLHVLGTLDSDMEGTKAVANQDDISTETGDGIDRYLGRGKPSRVRIIARDGETVDESKMPPEKERTPSPRLELVVRNGRLVDDEIGKAIKKNMLNFLIGKEDLALAIVISLLAPGMSGDVTARTSRLNSDAILTVETPQ
ncbi:MAG: hypothetical protein HY877_05510 [Deltaproteobacteria bacterium]|nr:hypothetical protein [Deltaproteobacteria bacterium]